MTNEKEKQAKINEMVRLGYIIKTQDKDWVIRYSLTDRGLINWKG